MVDAGILNGDVTATPATGLSAGDSVQLDYTADAGYILDTIVAETLAGVEVAIAEDGTFVMPAADVYVDATFVAVDGYMVNFYYDWAEQQQAHSQKLSLSPQ